MKGMKGGVKERYLFPDVMRGLSLAGILYAHLIFWYTGSALPDEVYLEYMDLPNGLAMAVFGVLVLGKFFAIFSFLFGLSFFIQQQSLKDSAQPYRVRQFTRISILLLTGFVHHIFWRGDILMIFGILAFILLIAEPLTTRTLLIAGVIFALNLPGMIHTLFVPENGSMSLPMEGGADRYYRLMIEGSAWQIFADNVRTLPAKILFQFTSGRLSRTLGFFLLGMCAGRSGLFFRPGTDQLIHKLLLASKVTLLLMLILAGGLFATGVIVFAPGEGRFESDLPLNHLYELYNITLVVFIVTGVHKMLNDERYRHRFGLFAYPGRMALTTYLMQTVAGLVLFCPFGLALFGKTPPFINVLLVVPLFAAQIAFSGWWFGRYRYGPAEWLWRSLTYMNFHDRNRINVHDAIPICGKVP